MAVNEESLNMVVYGATWFPTPWYRNLYGDSFRGYEGDGEDPFNPIDYKGHAAIDYRVVLY